MDYLKIPRSLIYKERNSLKDFGVQTPDTMNYLLFMRLKQQALMGVSGAREVALRCYNNAYYICTIILLEADVFPELRVSDYVDTILETEKENKYTDEVCLVSMAMACLLLAKYDEKKYGRHSDMWKAIYHRCTHFQWYHSSASEVFLNMMSLEYSFTFPLSNTEFEPHDIVEAVVEVGKTLGVTEVESHLYVDSKEYICERLACLDDPCKRMRGADFVIARLKNYLHVTYVHWGYDPKAKRFRPAPNGIIRDEIGDSFRLAEIVNPIEKTIDFITEHYPKKVKNDSMEETVESAQTQETETLQTKITELKSKLTQLEKQLQESNNINTQQATRIKELEAEVKNLQNGLKEAHTIPDTVTAQQKVRMELARKLMDAAGINETVLEKWGNKDKAGTVMGTMLDIVPSTCKTYLSDPSINHEHHKETVDKINPLLESLGLKFKL